MSGDLYISAYCRGGVTADAMGWLELGPMDAGGTGEGARKSEHMQTQMNTRIYPGSGPSYGGKTPTPACLSWDYSALDWVTMVLLELFS